MCYRFCVILVLVKIYLGVLREYFGGENIFQIVFREIGKMVILSVMVMKNWKNQKSEKKKKSTI